MRAIAAAAITTNRTAPDATARFRLRLEPSMPAASDTNPMLRPCSYALPIPRTGNGRVDLCSRSMPNQEVRDDVLDGAIQLGVRGGPEADSGRGQLGRTRSSGRLDPGSARGRAR